MSKYFSWRGVIVFINSVVLYSPPLCYSFFKASKNWRCCVSLLVYIIIFMNTEIHNKIEFNFYIQLLIYANFISKKVLSYNYIQDILKRRIKRMWMEHSIVDEATIDKRECPRRRRHAYAFFAFCEEKSALPTSITNSTN